MGAAANSQMIHGLSDALFVGGCIDKKALTGEERKITVKQSESRL